MRRPACRLGPWLSLLLACRHAPSIEQTPRPPSFERLEADERAESVAIERRIHRLSFRSLISLEVHDWFANSVFWASQRMDRHGVEIAAGRFFPRPRHRDGVVTFYLLDAESAAGSECEDAPHSPLCMRLRRARGTCAPMGPRTIACDDALFSRILVWAVSEVIVYALDEPDKESERFARIHSTYAAIERQPDPEQRTVERSRYARMVASLFYDDHEEVAARLTEMLIIVYAHELGHIVLGHDIDGYGDVAQAERAADEFAYTALRENLEILRWGVEGYLGNDHRSRRVHFVDSALAAWPSMDSPEGAEQRDDREARAMRRLAGCDVSHGTLTSRFASLLKLAAAHGGPHAASFQKDLEQIQWLVQANEEWCAEYPAVGSVTGARAMEPTR